MRWLAKLRTRIDSRLTLCGDSRQHHVVERGDFLRVLADTGALEPAGLTKIFRQKIPAMRDVIRGLYRGQTEKGFDKLNQFGVIQEIEDEAGRPVAMAGTAVPSNRPLLVR